MEVFLWVVHSEVDPIVASFSGGAVGVISSLMVVEVNNVKQQEQKRCIYCHGTGMVVHVNKHRFFMCMFHYNLWFT